ncbi:hypothetical protein N0V82_005517 [Gnomoniopsis sp. IMI 355080]|nr:hypothetical protein N0V82_005517 [Gnomoniopsis sp. IMI 355080]
MNCHAGLAFTVLGPAFERDSTGSSSSSPARSPPLPPVLCFHGSGSSNHYDTWLPLVQEISTFATVLFYERRGVGASSDDKTDSHSQTPRDALKDLLGLLQHLHLKPPYVLIAHSYGGTFAREFLQQYPDQVAGLVLAETGQETPTRHDEEQYRKQALGNKPLSVIHADSLHEKRRVGTTSAAGLEMLRKWAEEDERLKKAQMQLSSNARYIRVDDCGHNIVRHRPHIVSGEVIWVLNNVKPAQRPVGLWGFGRFLGERISRLRGQKSKEQTS